MPPAKHAATSPPPLFHCCSPAGTYAKNATGPCEPCAKFYYRTGDASPSNNVCNRIPAGYKEKAGAARKEIDMCPKGMVSNWLGTNGARNPQTETECKACTLNTHAPRTGMAVCAACKGGFVPASSQPGGPPDTCVICPSGNFRNAFTASATCEPCSAGNEVGSTRQTCTQCRPGSFMGTAEVTNKQNTCSDCAVSLPCLPPCLHASCLHLNTLRCPSSLLPCLTRLLACLNGRLG